MTDIAGTLPPGKERKVKAQQPYDIGNSKQKSWNAGFSSELL